MVSKPRKVKLYSQADMLIESNHGFYEGINFKTDKRWWAETAIEVARECGAATYAIRNEHKCEGKGCKLQTPYKYCASCHFDPKKHSCSS